MRSCHLLPWLLFAASALPAAAQPSDAARGQLLYSTHCIECHTVRMHWRQQKKARDWPTLMAQVRRWQAEARLQWSEQDINDVARHLNDTIYRFPPPVSVGQAVHKR
jgi:mono/diheme cytochrome c family protein